MKNLSGSIVAIVTPFLNGKVDEPALKNLIEWHIAEGTKGIVAVGTTGESPTLSHDEHRAVVELCVKTVAGRINVIAGVGSYNTQEAADLMRFSKQAGADAALAVTPYYNKPTQEGLIAHYTALHVAAELPIIIYNIPGRSVIDMSVDTLATLAKLPRIIGVKDATGDIARVSLQRRACGPDFIQLSGNDDSALGFNAQGGSGCISVVANVAPRLCAQLQNACARGDYKEALAIQDKLTPLNKALFMETSPAPVKFALSLLDKCKPDLRLPMVQIKPATQDAVRAALLSADIKF